jgi:hypothetical protein
MMNDDAEEEALDPNPQGIFRMSRTQCQQNSHQQSFKQE